MPFSKVIEPRVDMLRAIEESTQRMECVANSPNESRDGPSATLDREVCDPETPRLDLFTHENSTNLTCSCFL